MLNYFYKIPNTIVVIKTIDGSISGSLHNIVQDVDAPIGSARMIWYTTDVLLYVKFMYRTYWFHQETEMPAQSGRVYRLLS